MIAFLGGEINKNTKVDLAQKYAKNQLFIFSKNKSKHNMYHAANFLGGVAEKNTGESRKPCAVWLPQARTVFFISGQRGHHEKAVD